MTLPIQSHYYTSEELKQLNSKRIPAHIAIIPDGNRRWAAKRGLNSLEGFRNGANQLITIAKAAKQLGIKRLTYYIFSTENWRRHSLEIKAFFWLLESYILDYQQQMVDNNLRLRTMGDISALSKSVQTTIRNAEAATINGTDIEVVLAINYGARDEIRRAVIGILNDYNANLFTQREITESLISRYMDSKEWDDPDLVIRTSGESRLSNFLLWQSSYSEFYTDNDLWPDFTPRHLFNAVLRYQDQATFRRGA